MSIVIQVENLSKQYHLGLIGTGTIRDDFTRLWARIRGKEDPTLKIGMENSLTGNNQSDKGKMVENYVWALRDVNFSLEKGEVLGIIGKNGAGKSTLLKILSKVTTPTTGQVKVRGRIASLLEVGTGFHPELTGRENIFLNGAILGMTKTEIKSKFDEIVEFSGVEKYIDTPVKRYSSGMYVRLAFAVAAHLEPEILIVDEVLAVGDAEFQKKCLGKMKDVSGQGRTVIFVSHNMNAVSDLCSKGVLLSNGFVKKIGEMNSVINEYITDSKLNYQKNWSLDNAPGNNEVKIICAYFIDENRKRINTAFITNKVGVCIEYEVLSDIPLFINGINVFNKLGVHLFTSHEMINYDAFEIIKKGQYLSVVWIPANLLQDGEIKISFAAMRYNPFRVLFHEEDIICLSVIDKMDSSSRNNNYRGNLPGLIRPSLAWEERKNI